MLTDHFINKFAKMLNKPDLRISGEALRFLVGLPWEGNVRELENTIERAAILCSGNVIKTEDVHPDVTSSKEAANWSPDVDFEKFIPSNLPLPEVLSGVEEQMVKRALEDANFVQARAAESLGITKSLLQYKMKKFNLQKK
jgi:two-component system NtrC family response regulator